MSIYVRIRYRKGDGLRVLILIGGAAGPVKQSEVAYNVYSDY